MDLQANSKFDAGKLEPEPTSDPGSSFFSLKLKSFQNLQRKYPQVTEFALCSLIGGFFFLRFINPAIVTPQAYMLVDGVPAKNPRRTLTLIAKMLQNLANKPTQSKEAYMATLNPFVETNKARMNGFLNSLCEVGDFYDSLEVSRVMLTTGQGDGADSDSARESLTNTWHCPRRICKSTSRSMSYITHILC